MLKTSVFKYLAKLSQKTADVFHVFPEKQERTLGSELSRVARGRMFRLWRHPTAGGAAWPPRLGRGSAEAAGPRAGRWENSFPPHPCCHHLRVIPVSVNGANPHGAGEDEHLNLLFALLPTSGPSAESISKPSTSPNPSAAGLVHARVLSPGELWRSPRSLHTLFPAPRPEIHSARCAYPTNQIILAAFQRLPWEAAPAIFSLITLFYFFLLPRSPLAILCLFS